MNRPWGNSEGYRVVRYHHTNWYGSKTSRWKVEETISQWNDFVDWRVQYVLAEFKSEDDAIAFVTTLKQKEALDGMERKRREIKVTEEVSQRWKDD